jgi:peptide/nickel transport system substrate-binding protein
VREAISLAVDRKALAQDLMKGTAIEARTYLLPGLIGYDDKAVPFVRDVARAKRLLTEAGYSDGFVLESHLRNTHMNDNLGHLLLAIQNQIKEVGIDLKIVQVDGATMNEMRTAGKVPIEIWDWYSDFPDPDGYMYSFLYSSNAKVLTSNYNSPEFDKLMDDARSITDTAKRAGLYKKADHLATRVDYAAIPLFHEKLYYLCKPYVKDLHKSPENQFHFFDAYIDLAAKK